MLIETYTYSVIPACPESVSPQQKDSGQAGMTEVIVCAGLHLNLRNELS